MISGFAADRNAIIPYTTITKRKSAFVRFDYLMTVRTGYMAGCQFNDLPIVLPRDDKTSYGFVFIPGLLHAPKTAGDMSNLFLRHQGVDHQ